MPNDTVRASDTALPKSRRLFLIAGTSGALLSTLKGAALASKIVVDDEILALAAEVIRLNAVSDGILEERVVPFDEEFDRLLFAPRVSDLSMQQAFAFSQECGRAAAIEDQAKVDVQADVVFRRMMAIPCTTQAGRAAKVRPFLVHVGHHEWRGPGEDLNWPEEQARMLLAEFAGMSAEEIANV
jgi:hypothetical protein